MNVRKRELECLVGAEFNESWPEFKHPDTQTLQSSFKKTEISPLLKPYISVKKRGKRYPSFTFFEALLLFICLAMESICGYVTQFLPDY